MNKIGYARKNATTFDLTVPIFKGSIEVMIKKGSKLNRFRELTTRLE